MAGDDNKPRVVEKFRVSPPAGSVPETTLPLTFFDVPWLIVQHTQRLYFYPLSHQTHRDDVVSALKKSLSLALRQFFPYSGNLVSPPPPEKPRIQFRDGDSLSFVVAESGADFDSLCVDSSRDVRQLHSLLPDLAPDTFHGRARVAPLMALQVTIFGKKGFCIGVKFRHVAADGRSLHHFMKYWASICKSQDVVAPEIPIPSHDRSVIEDPSGRNLMLLKDLWALTSTWKDHVGQPPRGFPSDTARLTLILSRAQIERLKRWLVGRAELTDEDDCVTVISSFVAVSALVWVSLVKSNAGDVSETCVFFFAADCRGRLDFPVPATYFGNCLSFCLTEVKISELIGESGMVLAAKAIAKRISEFGAKGGYLKDAESLVSKWKRHVETGQRVVSVAGSAKLGMYEADFGFGKPLRTESVQIDGPDACSVAENRDDLVGGMEIGLVMTTEKISHFTAVFENALKLDLH